MAAQGRPLRRAGPTRAHILARDYTGRNVDHRGRNVESDAFWTLAEPQELFDEWVLTAWQNRPHDALRDPRQAARTLSPNEMYAAMVAAAGHVPLTLTGDDYIELLPVEWRTINACSIQFDNRTYDGADLNPYRRQPSGVATKGNRWEIHYDPYDLRHVWLVSTIAAIARSTPMP